MSEIPYACLYRSYEKELELLRPEQLGRLMWALLRFLNHGEEPELPEPECYLWPRFREQHLRDCSHYNETCERNRKNGSKGGRPAVKRACPKPAGFERDAFITEKPGGFEEDQTDAPKAVGPKEREKEKEKEKEKHTITEDEVCVIYPSEEEVSSFCQEKGLRYVEPERFVSYYSSVGWRINGQPIRDWKAAAKLWNQRERRKVEDQHGLVGTEPTGQFGTVV